MNENELKRNLVEAIKETLPGATVLPHQDVRTNGIPDLSITWKGRTVWVEVKYDRPKTKSKLEAIQLVMLKRLGGILVTYVQERDGSKRIEVKDFKEAGKFAIIEQARGFDHRGLARHLRLERFAADTNFKRVLEFHEKFDLPIEDRPVLENSVAQRRMEHIYEETEELQDAIDMDDLPGVADALVDIVYLCLGMAVNLGIPWEQCFAAVHQANMLKSKGTKDGPSHLGIVKPKGWKAPDIKGIIEEWQ